MRDPDRPCSTKVLADKKNALTEHDEQTWTLLECLPSAIVLIDERGTIVFVNGAAAALFAEDHEQLVGSSLTERMPSASAERLRARMAVASRRPLRTEGCSLRTRRAGKMTPVTLSLSEVRTPAAERFVLVTIDRTDVHGAAAHGTSQQDEADARFRELIDALPNLVWIASAAGHCYHLNWRWQEFTGAPVETLLGRGWLEHVHPDDREPVLARARHSIASGDPYQIEFRLRRHDGQYRWFYGRGHALRDHEGSVVKWVGANFEIHDWYTLRARLLAEQERLTSVLENSPGVVVSFERNARGEVSFTFLSSGAQELFGFSPAQIQADVRILVSHVHPDDRQRLFASIAAAMDARLPISEEVRYEHPTAGATWLVARATARTTPEGNILWSGLVTDATARRSAEAALETARAQLESALEAAEMGAWVWNYDRQEIWGNVEQRRLWEVPDEIPPWFSPELVMSRIHPDDIARARIEVEAALASGTRLEVDFRLIPLAGGVRWVTSRGRVERSADGLSRRFAGINMDITRQKLAADSALRSSKLEALGTLAGGIAHDFNNILFAIGGNATLALQATPPTSPVHEKLQVIETASRRAAELVRQILTFSRHEEQPREVMTLIKPIDEALRLVRATTPRTIAIEAQLDANAPPVLVDEAQMTQVVLNLCTNASHAIGRGRAGKIELTLDEVEVAQDQEAHVPAGKYVRLAVSDDGCGIPGAMQTRVFDPFFTTKAQGEGTGLGLSVVHGIVQSMGGFLTLWSEPGRGSIFRLYIPPAARSRVAAAPASAPAPPGREKYVMLIDDESALVALGKAILASLGYRPMAFQDPHAALEAFRSEPNMFAAVITDLAMPGLSGFEVVRSLRAIRADVPVALVSGYLGSEERAIAAALGIHEVAVKPLSIDEIGQMLGRLCND